MLKIKQTAQFKKDLKAAIRQNCDLNLLEHIIDQLANQKPLDEKHYDHALTGNLSKYRVIPVAIPVKNKAISSRPHIFVSSLSNSLLRLLVQPLTESLQPVGHD